VLHYLPDLKSPFLEFKRVLKPGGRLVFSVHHPSLVFHDHQLPDYYQTTWVEEEWSVGKVGFYHHPLIAYTEGLASAGFVIERLVEAHPVEEFKIRDPESYEKIMHNPWFLFFRARSE
jgi:SAM-dependent methyltransferase